MRMVSLETPLSCMSRSGAAVPGTRDAGTDAVLSAVPDAAGAVSLSDTVNSVPFPSSDVNVILPPSFFTTLDTIRSPKPVPMAS